MNAQMLTRTKSKQTTDVSPTATHFAGLPADASNQFPSVPLNGYTVISREDTPETGEHVP